MSNMDLRSEMKRIHQPTSEALARYERGRVEGESSPQPGAVYLFEETAELGVFWAVIEEDPEQERFLLVAADGNLLVGSGDVAVPPGTGCGPLSLRCRFEVWLEEADFERATWTGFLDSTELERVLDKRARLAAGERVGSVLEQETDGDTEYEDWIDELKIAQAILRTQRTSGRDLRDEMGRDRGPTRNDLTRYKQDASPQSDTFPEAEGVDWQVFDDRPLELVVQIDAEESLDRESWEDMALQLLAETRQLEVQGIERLQSRVSIGSRGEALGAIRITVSPVGLQELLEFLREWSLRNKYRSIKIRSAEPSDLRELSVETSVLDDLQLLARGLIQLNKKDGTDT